MNGEEWAETRVRRIGDSDEGVEIRAAKGNLF